jgi:hypothetical protein
MMYIIALVNFAYAPLMFFLRKLPETLPEKPAEVNGDASLGPAIKNVTSLSLNDSVFQGSLSTEPISHYQSIAGITDPTIAIRPGPNYQYDIGSVWDD